MAYLLGGAVPKTLSQKKPVGKFFEGDKEIPHSEIQRLAEGMNYPERIPYDCLLDGAWFDVFVHPEDDCLLLMWELPVSWRRGGLK